jgi:hypothetical protein
MLTENVLLLPPLVERSEHGDFKFSPSRELARLRRYLLYFPKIAVIPYWNPAIGLNLVSEDHQLLFYQQQVGAIQYRMANVDKLGMPFFEHDLASLFLSLNEGNQEFRFSSAGSLADVVDNPQIANSYLCKIVDALPAPHPDAPLADIIQLREERKEELRRFGRRIERIVASYSAVGPNNDTHFQFALEEMEEHICNLEKSFSETGLVKGRVNLSIGNFVNSALIPGMAALIAAQLASPEAAAAATAAASLIQVNLARTKVGNSGNAYPRDFQYLIDANSRSIIGDQNDFPDDYIHCALLDSNNCFGFGMPEQGSRIHLPYNTSSPLYNNVLG